MADMLRALQAAGVAPARALEWAEPMAAAAALHDITTARRLAAWVAQCAHETGGFTKLREGLRYRDPARLDSLFSAVRGLDDARALIAHGEMAIANRVYAGRNGNGDEASGDGWRYRGGGCTHLTGRRNYRLAGEALGMPLEAKPELVEQPAGAAMTAAWYWLAADCSRMADRGDIDGITRVINGSGMAGREERAALYRAALRGLGVAA